MTRKTLNDCAQCEALMNRQQLIDCLNEKIGDIDLTKPSRDQFNVGYTDGLKTAYRNVLEWMEMEDGLVDQETKYFLITSPQLGRLRSPSATEGYKKRISEEVLANPVSKDTSYSWDWCLNCPHKTEAP